MLFRSIPTCGNSFSLATKLRKRINLLSFSKLRNILQKYSYGRLRSSYGMGWRFNDETEMELFGITFEPEKENVLTMEWKRLIDGIDSILRQNGNG